MKIDRTKGFVRSLRAYSDSELKAVAEAMLAAGDRFGRPHSHSAIDIRRLGRNLFECRAGLDIRLLFKVEKETLVFLFAGNHDDVQSYLRNLT
jgi:mRNA-degrading endonuclease YafQ of YafQ-DinJ toxin-antitoxin module